MQRNAQCGFTFIEMIVGLAVLAVMLSLAIPAMARFVEEQRLTAGANHLVAHLQFARGQAISLNNTVTACPSTDGRYCTGGNRWDEGWIVYRDPQRGTQPRENADVLRVVQGARGLVMASGGRYRVRFRGTGVAYGTNLTISVCMDGERTARRAVIVSNPGRVRATRTATEGACPGP